MPPNDPNVPPPEPPEPPAPPASSGASAVEAHPPQSPGARPPKRGASFIWIVFKRLVVALYILLATLFSLWIARRATEGGLPVHAYAPGQPILSLRIWDVDKSWRAIEVHPDVMELWRDPEFQRWSKMGEGFSKARAKWRRLPGLVRRIFGRDLDRENLHDLAGLETAVYLLPPRKLPGEKEAKPPGVIFLRVQGGRGTLLRMLGAVANLTRGKKSEEERQRDPVFHDLGGGLIAFAPEGIELSTPGEGEASPPLVPSGAVAELSIRPKDLLLHADEMSAEKAGRFEKQVAQKLVKPPDWLDILRLRPSPDELRLVLEPDGHGGLAGHGTWTGPLPAKLGGAALLDPSLPASTEPLLDAELPVDAGAWFWHYLFSEINGSEKNTRRWLERLGRMGEDGVNLDRDLFPYAGGTLRLAVAPPPDGWPAKQELILVALPLDAQDPPRAALRSLARARWNNLFDNRPGPDAEKEYVLRFPYGTNERFVLNREGKFTHPLWTVSDGGFAVLSDGGPDAIFPTAPAPAQDADFLRSKAWRSSSAKPLWYLHLDGARMAHAFGALYQMKLEDERDNATFKAADFLERHPDEAAEVRMIENLARFGGAFVLEVRAPEQSGEAAEIELRWRPKLQSDP